MWSPRFGFLALILICPVVAGCKKGPPPLVRDPVTKITGTILIDGKPEEMVGIRLVPVDGPNKALGTSRDLTPSGFSAADGTFSIGTYEKGPNGDGAPKGAYVATFQWGSLNLISGGYTGDKFNGKYLDPDYSEIKVTVADQPVDLGKIELDTKPAPARPKKSLPGQQPATGVD